VSLARKTFFWIPCLQVVTKSISFGLKLLSDPIMELLVMVLEYACDTCIDDEKIYVSAD
jgi:hypothetical protein